jgi:hypothetical protein
MRKRMNFEMSENGAVTSHAVFVCLMHSNQPMTGNCSRTIYLSSAADFPLDFPVPDKA